MKPSPTDVRLQTHRTEKLFGGNPVYDTGAGLVSRLVEKIAGNGKLIKALSSLPADLISEGLEEIAADILEPVSELLVTGHWTGCDLDRIIEDGAVGVLLTGMGKLGEIAFLNGLEGKETEYRLPGKKELQVPGQQGTMTY